MKAKIINLDSQPVKDIVLSKDIFGLPVRADILQRVVLWQLAKRQAGTHKAKGISEISGTTRKPYKQKGTGHARQGSLRSPQFRGGAVIFGPVVRSHAFALNKKVRSLGLKTALSAKYSEGKLLVLDALRSEGVKTKDLAVKIQGLGLSAPLFVDVDAVDPNFLKSLSNIAKADFLPVQGVNVYDILKHKELVLTQGAVEALEARFK